MGLLKKSSLWPPHSAHTHHFIPNMAIFSEKKFTLPLNSTWSYVIHCTQWDSQAFLPNFVSRLVDVLLIAKSSVLIKWFHLRALNLEIWLQIFSERLVSTKKLLGIDALTIACINSHVSKNCAQVLTELQNCFFRISYILFRGWYAKKLHL